MTKMKREDLKKQEEAPDSGDTDEAQPLKLTSDTTMQPRNLQSAFWLCAEG